MQADAKAMKTMTSFMMTVGCSGVVLDTALNAASEGPVYYIVFLTAGVADQVQKKCHGHLCMCQIVSRSFLRVYICLECTIQHIFFNESALWADSVYKL